MTKVVTGWLRVQITYQKKKKDFNHASCLIHNTVYLQIYQCIKTLHQISEPCHIETCVMSRQNLTCSAKKTINDL